jgi:hypothetical protein
LRQTCQFHRMKNTQALRANYSTSDFSVQLLRVSHIITQHNYVL